VYDEWTSAETIVEGSHEVIMRNYGTRSKAEGAIQHAGLVRQVAFNDFRQLTYTMEGQKNGMSIGVAAADIPELGEQVEGQVVFHTPAEEGKAQVTFSWMFNELSRTDPEKLLTTVEPKQL